jgi:hypothetical protein
LEERNYEPDPESAAEGREQCGPLVGKRHRQHQRDIYGAKDQAAQQADSKTRHAGIG